MKDIGLKLKEAREAKGLSLEEVASLTKITKGRLEAIESGNIEYFNNDTSYVKYYVNLYAKVVDVDYDSFKDELKNSLIEFDEMTRTNVFLERKLMEQNINEKVQELGPKKEKRNIDIKLIAIVAAIVVLLILLSVLAISYIKDNNSKTHKEPHNVDPIVDPIVDPDKEKKEDKPIVENQEVEIYNDSLISVKQNANDKRYYYVTGYNVNQINYPAFKVGDLENTISVYFNDVLISDCSKTWMMGTRVFFDKVINVDDSFHITMSTNSNTRFIINEAEFEIDSSVNEIFIIFR